MFTKTVDVQEGIWIDAEILLRAGLNQHQLQIIIQAGAVWLTMAPDMAELQVNDSLSTEPYCLEQDPLIGLFDGSENLSEDAEKILAEEIVKDSGFTWKT